MAVCAPLTAYRIGRRRLRSAVVVIVAASVAFNAPRFFEFRPTAVPLTLPHGLVDERPADDVGQSVTISAPGPVTMIVLGDTWLRYDEVYQYVYNTAMLTQPSGGRLKCWLVVYHVANLCPRVLPALHQHRPVHLVVYNTSLF